MKNALIILCLAALTASLAGIMALHEPPQTYHPGESVSLMVEIINEGDALVKIDLCYRPTGTSEFSLKALDAPLPGTQGYTVQLQPIDLQGLDLEYCFKVELPDGETFLYPDESQGAQLFTLKAQIQQGKVSKGFILLSTEDDFAQKGEYVLAVSYYSIAREIDPKTIEVWVNGRNVTSKAVITSNLLSYRDPRPKTDQYKAVITALDRNKVLIKSDTFVTRVNPKSGKARLDVWGAINFASNFHSQEPTAAASILSYEHPEDSYAGWLDFYGRYKKLTVNFNTLHSSFEDPNRQPVDRYRLGLELAFLKLQAGDYAPQLSPLALSNKTLRGVYGSLFGSYIALELAGGEMVRKTTSEGDPDRVTAFRQEALGGKLRLGSDKGLSMSLTLARIRDVISSLEPEDFIYYDSVTSDTLFVVTPQDNLVAAVNTRINIPALNTNLGLEVASSLYNRNTWPGPISAEEVAQYIAGLDLIDPADLAQVFVINRNMEPLLPGLPNCAAKAYLRTNILNNIIDVNASMTGPAYYALGTWDQKQDTQTITVSDMFNISRNIFLSGAYSWQRDNLFSTASETNTYRILHFQGTLRLLKYFSLRGAFYNSDASNSANPAIEGYVFSPYERNSNAYTVGIGFNNAKVNYLPYLCELSYQNGLDHSQIGEGPGLDYQTNNSSNSINLSLLSKFGKIPLRLQFNASLAELEKEQMISASQDNSLNLHARISYSIFKDKLVPYLQYRRSGLSGDQGSQARDYISLGVDAYPWKNMSLSTSLNRQSTVNNPDAEQNGQNFTWSLTLGQRF